MSKFSQQPCWIGTKIQISLISCILKWFYEMELQGPGDLPLSIQISVERHFWLSPFRICSTNRLSNKYFSFHFAWILHTTRCIKKDSFKVLLSYITAANIILSIWKKAVDKIEEILTILFYSNSCNCKFDILAQLTDIISEVLLLFECNAPVTSRDFYETFLVIILEEYFMKTQIHQTESGGP